MNPVRRIRTVADAVLARVALVGADPRDDEDTRSSKALLVLISVLILPIALLWGVLYLAFGSPVGFVPLVYFVVLLGAIGVFSRTRDFAQLLRVNLLDILLAPTLSMIPLGGFLDSGGVGLWGILAPLGALVTSATTISPSPALSWRRTITWSPSRMPASFIESPRTRNTNSPSSPPAMPGTGTYSSMFSSASTGCPAAT